MGGEEPKTTWDDVDRALEHRDKNELDLVQMDQTMKMVFYGSLKEFKEHFMQDDPANTGRPKVTFIGETMHKIEEVIAGGLHGTDGLGTVDDLRRFSAVVDAGPPKPIKVKSKKKGGKWWINNKYGRFAK